MKRKRMVTYLILFAMAVFLFAGGMNSQAKTEGISLNQKKLTLRVGQTERLKVRGTTRKVKWSSSNKKVAAVSKEGVVKAKKKGKAVITATAETDPTKKPGYENGNAGVVENEKIPEKLQEIPTDYYREADRQGSLVELKYETYESKTYGQKSKKLNKRAIVYLPYGYSEKERYNVFYLMHGGWSNETAWLGTPERPGTFKNVIDHAVSDGKMKPFIIVCPTYNNESPSDSSDYTLAYGTLTVNYHNELMNDLIPAVEGTYSTYADNVTPEGIKSSRDHRAFGGFSMGSVATWHTFLNCLDAFRYFMPSSGAIDSSGNSLDRAVTESGYTWKDFFIFAATGTSDFACSQFTNQIDGMLGQKSGNFREADNEAEGNLAFRIKEGYSHDGRASTEYAYNGMLWFWNHGNNKQSVEKVTEDIFVQAQQEITQGTSYYREFLVDNVYHSEKNGDIHYNVYFPDSYDGKKEMALYITLPGYQGLYFQGVAENIKTEDFGFEAQKYNSDMVILAPQLDDWGEKSANQTIALVEYFLSHYRIDASKVYINGYSGGGETLSLVLGKRPELFTRALMCSSQWDGEYEPVVKAGTPVYFVIGESDEYYSSKPFKDAYQKLYNLYRKQGLSEKQIKKLLVLDVKGSSYFQGTGITYQHGGGYLFCRDKDIMGWLFKK